MNTLKNNDKKKRSKTENEETTLRSWLPLIFELHCPVDLNKPDKTDYSKEN